MSANLNTDIKIEAKLRLLKQRLRPKRLMLKVGEEPYMRAIGFQFELAWRAGDIPRAMTFARFIEMRAAGIDPFLTM